jgi:hypothetical protein
MSSVDLAARISISFGAQKIKIDNPLFWIGVIIILLFFLRWWGIKKFISFSLIISVLLFLMFKADSFIAGYFGKDEGNFYGLLAKPLFLFFIGIVFVYYVFLKKE